MDAESTGYYVRAADGRRTRIYINLEAARRAEARGELYTDEEYAALTAITSPPKRKKTK